MADPDLETRADAPGEFPGGGARRVLVVGPSWVGDMVMAQSLFKALMRTPGTLVDVVAPERSHSLLCRMPEVHKTIAAPFQSGRLQIGRRYRLARQLSITSYDQAIVLPNSWKSALLPFLAGVPRRTGYTGEQRWGLLNDVRKMDPHELPMTVQRFATLADDPGGPVKGKKFERPALRTSYKEREKTVFDLGLSIGTDRILVLCPGAEYGPSKCWPAEYYASVARSKLADGWQVWLIGSERDGQPAREINRLCEGRGHDLTGQTSIGQAIDLLSLADVVVSNDSGLMHICAALGKPQIAIFGSTDPEHTPPLSEACQVHYLALSCSPCFKRHCPLQHNNCLTQLSPERILASLEAIAGAQ